MFSLFESVKPNKFTKDELTAIRNTFNILIKKYDDYEYKREHVQAHEGKIDAYGFKSYIGEFISIPINFNKRSFDFTFFKSGSFLKNLDKNNDLEDSLIDFGYRENLTFKEIVAKIELVIKERVKSEKYSSGLLETITKISIPIYYKSPETRLIMTDESKDSFKTFSKYYESL